MCVCVGWYIFFQLHTSSSCGTANRTVCVPASQLTNQPCVPRAPFNVTYAFFNFWFLMLCFLVFAAATANDRYDHHHHRLGHYYCAKAILWPKRSKWKKTRSVCRNRKVNIVWWSSGLDANNLEIVAARPSANWIKYFYVNKTFCVVMLIMFLFT